jgi:hypothetical protein
LKEVAVYHATCVKGAAAKLYLLQYFYDMRRLIHDVPVDLKMGDVLFKTRRPKG